MKSTPVFVLGMLISILSLSVLAGTGTTYLASTSPPRSKLELIRHAFLELGRPIDHELHRREYPRNLVSVRYEVDLKGDARKFAQRYSLNDRLYALSDLLRDPEHSLAAFLVLSSSDEMSYMTISVAKEGKCPEKLTSIQEDDIRRLMGRVRMKLGKPQWWKGPDSEPLHDYTSMMHDCAHRAEYIETLRAMLRDRALIKKHKLEMTRIFAALHGMEATNAAPEIADYLIVDKNTMEDITPEALTSTNHGALKTPVCPAAMTLAELGAGSIVPVLDKLVRLAEESGYTSYRVDAAVLFTISLFNYLGLKNEDGISEVERFRTGRAGLTEQQSSALDRLVASLHERDDTDLHAFPLYARVDTREAYSRERARESLHKQLQMMVGILADVTDATLARDANSLTLTVTATWADLGQDEKTTIAMRMRRAIGFWAPQLGWTSDGGATTNYPTFIFVGPDGKQVGTHAW